MPPTTPELMELVYASKLLAKTIDEVDEKISHALEKIDAQQTALSNYRDLISTVDKKLELLPLVLAGKLEALIEKRTGEAFEDIRTSLDELRNKLWAIKKQIKDQTGSFPTPRPESQQDKEDGVSVRRGKFRMDLPISEGTLKVLKVVGIVLFAIAGIGGAGGGIWALIDRIRHVLSGSG